MKTFKNKNKKLDKKTIKNPHLKILNRYKHIILPIGGVGLAGAVTTAIVAPIMVAKIAKEQAEAAFEKIIPLGGPYNYIQKDQALTYLAIGDSLTAGYNAFMKDDKTATGGGQNSATRDEYVSYSDFIASNFNKANMLKEYRNFAVSGYTIPQSRQLLLRDQGNLALLQKTNLITLSLGANDFLSAVQILKIPFKSLTSGDATSNEEKTITEINTARDAIISKFGNKKDSKYDPQGNDNYYSKSASAYASKEGITKLIRDSFDKLINITKNGTASGIFDIERELYDKVFGLIQLDLATYINELHQAAPNARIIVMGYPFPFHKLPGTVIKDGTNSMGVSVENAFQKFEDTIKATVEKANYAEFYNPNELKEFSSDSDLIMYKKEGASESIVVHEWNRVMPNILDIHPSTYGHQVISGHLYQHLMEESEIDVIKYQSISKLFVDYNANTPEGAASIKKLEKYILSLNDTYTYSSSAYDNLKNINDFEHATNPGIKEDWQSAIKTITIFDEGQKNNHDLMEILINLLNSSLLLKDLSAIISNGLDIDKFVETTLISASGVETQRYKELIKSLSLNPKTNKEYIATDDKIGIIIEELKKVVKPALYTVLDNFTGPDILTKIINGSSSLATYLEGVLPDTSLSKILVNLINDISQLDPTLIDANSITITITQLTKTKPGANVIADIIVLANYAVSHPDSELTKVLIDWTKNMTITQGTEIRSLITKIPALFLGTLFMLSSGHALDLLNMDDVQTFITDLQSAATRIGIDSSNIKDAISIKNLLFVEDNVMVKLSNLINVKTEEEAEKLVQKIKI